MILSRNSWSNLETFPINEFKHEGYNSFAFPTLIPTGAAKFLGHRKNTVTSGNGFKHLKYRDGRFVRHPRSRYIALNAVLRWRTIQIGDILFVRKNPDVKKLSINELNEMKNELKTRVKKRILRFARPILTNLH